MGPLLFSPLLRGDKFLSLDLRMNLSSGALVRRTEKQLSGWCSLKLEQKDLHYRGYIYCILFDVGFFAFFFFLNHRHFRTTLWE